MLFFLLFTLALAILVPFCYQAYMYRQKALANKPADYQFPQMADFSLTVKAAAVFSLIELLCRCHLYKYYLPYCKEQKDLVMREVRSIKATVHIYKAIYYLGASIYAYKVSKDTHFLHYLYGGKANDFAAGLQGYPYQDRSSYPEFKTYYLVGMGYHLSSVTPLIYSASKKDFVEMMLHHFCCLFLYGGGYLMNI